MEKRLKGELQASRMESMAMKAELQESTALLRQLLQHIEVTRY